LTDSGYNGSRLGYNLWKMRTTGEQTVLQIEADAAAYGIRKVPDAYGKMRWFITCTDCGKDDSVFHASLRTADHLMSHFTKRGWLLNRKESQYCSTQCARAARAKKQAERKEIEVTQPTPPPTPVTAIGPDPKIVRRVITLLNENFDTDKRLYAAGWDDARIAKEAATSLEFVTKYRREGYGELAEDPELGRLREDIKAMDDLFSGQLKQLEQSFAQQLAELRGRADRLGKSHHKASG
jgi:hypothetical protein